MGCIEIIMGIKTLRLIFQIITLLIHTGYLRVWLITVALGKAKKGWIRESIKIQNPGLSWCVDRNPPANTGVTSWIPVLGRFHNLRSHKLVCHNYWAHTPELTSHHEELQSSPHLPQFEKACTKQWRPSTAKNKVNKIKKIKRIRIQMFCWPMRCVTRVR